MAFLKSGIKSQFFGNAHLFVGVPSCPYFSTLAFFFFLFFLLLTWECPCCDVFDNSWLRRASQRIRSSEQFNLIYCLDYKCSILLQSISEKAAFFFPLSCCYSCLPVRDSTKVLNLWYSTLSLPWRTCICRHGVLSSYGHRPGNPTSSEHGELWISGGSCNWCPVSGFHWVPPCCERSWRNFRLPYRKDTWC